jgi:hypothetical protein
MDASDRLSQMHAQHRARNARWYERHREAILQRKREKYSADAEARRRGNSLARREGSGAAHDGCVSAVVDAV